jgi:large subunit ribosomal protein L16
MLFTPKKFKFKKQQKGRSFNKIQSSVSKNILGAIGLKAITCGRITSKQLITIKQIGNKVIKKVGKLYIYMFAQTPITKKPKEIRMGKGKGAVDHWVNKIKSGFIICEIKTDYISIGIKALKAIQIRLPIKTKIIFS